MQELPRLATLIANCFQRCATHFVQDVNLVVAGIGDVKAIVCYRDIHRFELPGLSNRLNEAVVPVVNYYLPPHGIRHVAGTILIDCDVDGLMAGLATG